MRKIPTLFARNYGGDYCVRDEVVPGAEWVVAGEGIATRKWDGTAILVQDGKLYRRYERKAGKPAPPDFFPAQDPDPVTGNQPGWIPVADGPADRWVHEAVQAWAAAHDLMPPDGTYELCGPKINSNPDRFSAHVLVRHGTEIYSDCPRTFEAIKTWLSCHDLEGIVWHHPDGRMVKIKGKDFGLRRPR